MNESITPDTVRLALNNLDARVKYLESKDASDDKARSAALEAENKRLRKALQDVKTATNPEGPDRPSSSWMAEIAHATATKALTQETTNG